MQRRWMGFLLWSGVLIFMPNIIMGLLKRPDLTMQWSNFAALTAALIQGYFLLLHPELLYGPMGDNRTHARLPGKKGGLASPEKSLDNKPAYYDQLDEQSVRQIEMAITTWIREKQVYLNPDLTLAGLSSLSGIGLHKWSAYLNKFQQTGFNDYINRSRVDHCVQKMHDGEHRSKTLEALSQESGFNSRSTFIRAFKKFKGLTPSEYLEARERS
jgi:AraC-like DNA-binding protein